MKVRKGGFFMNGEQIFGIILMTFINLMCAGIFYGIGVWANKRKDPMHFYAGSTIDPKTISDIPAYNRENAKLWKMFSVPFWFCAGCAFGSIWMETLMTVSIIILVLGCTVGIGWLVWKYSKIHRKYRISKS